MRDLSLRFENRQRFIELVRVVENRADAAEGLADAGAVSDDFVPLLRIFNAASAFAPSARDQDCGSLRVRLFDSQRRSTMTRSR